MSDKEFARALRSRAVVILSNALAKVKGEGVPHVDLDEVMRLRSVAEDLLALAQMATRTRR